MKLSRDNINWFRFGVLLFGGLGIVPLVYGSSAGVSFLWSVVPSVVSCGLFLFSLNDQGRIQIGKLLLAMCFAFFLIAVYPQNTNRPLFLAGGVVGYLLMYVCGLLGVCMGQRIEARAFFTGTREVSETAAVTAGVLLLLVIWYHGLVVELRTQRAVQEILRADSLSILEYGTPERPLPGSDAPELKEDREYQAMLREFQNILRTDLDGAVNVKTLLARKDFLLKRMEKRIKELKK